MKWEHKVVKAVNSSALGMEGQLDFLSKSRWKLVAVTVDKDSQHTFFLRRRLYSEEEW